MPKTAKAKIWPLRTLGVNKLKKLVEPKLNVDYYCVYSMPKINGFRINCLSYSR
jgi:hypothetical protein